MLKFIDEIRLVNGNLTNVLGRSQWPVHVLDMIKIMDRSFAYLVAMANLDDLIATYFFIYLEAYLVNRCHRQKWIQQASVG